MVSEDVEAQSKPDEKVGDGEEKVEDGEESKPKPPSSLWDKLVYGGTAGGIGVCATAAALNPVNGLVLAMAAPSAAVTAPLVAYNQKLIQDSSSLRELQNELRREANRLGGINDELSNNVDELENEVGKLKEVEGNLQNMVGKQGANVDKLVNLVQENKETIEEMKLVMKSQILEDFMGAVLRSDSDGSGKFDGQELEILLMRMQFNDGVEIDETKLRASFDKLKDKSGVLTVSACMEAMGGMLDDDDSDGVTLTMSFGGKKW